MTLQLVALVSGAFEIWFALWLFDHPVSVGAALMLESMTQAIRHVAFVVPAGLGVQEAGLVVFGHVVGISGEMALAVGMVKRIRELAWGMPTLVGWQWVEGRRLRRGCSIVSLVLRLPTGIERRLEMLWRGLPDSGARAVDFSTPPRGGRADPGAVRVLAGVQEPGHHVHRRRRRRHPRIGRAPRAHGRLGAFAISQGSCRAAAAHRRGRDAHRVRGAQHRDTR